MSKKTLFITNAGIIAAFYVVISYAQVLIAPSSVYSAIQFRISEALMMLCVYSPAAISGLTFGCIIVNIANSPIDIIIGSLATLLAGIFMYMFRQVRLFKLPVLSAFMPAVFNGLLISAEINLFFTEHFGWQAFLITALSVFAGELSVLLIVGLPFVRIFENQGLHNKIFGKQ